MDLPVSVIIVSRDRAEALQRCLTGLAQLDYAAFEVVVVACPKGAAALRAGPYADLVKLVEFDEANISQARNLGICAAAGEVVAFIDDDAVPEPLWLRHLVAPFQDGEVAATGGFVIGRNGMSFQWRARSVDVTGAAQDIAFEDMSPRLLHPQPDRAIKTEGTNMAVRRDVLAEMGGFDPAFHFYLDETDLNMRLAQAGQATAIVPLAQVHHGFAESARRSQARVPRDLSEIAASQMVFLRKHSPEKTHKKAMRGLRREQRLRLLKLLQTGPLGADDVLRLLRGFDRGARDGRARIISALPALPFAADGFRPFPGRPDAPRRLLTGRPLRAKALREEAAARAADGDIVTLLLMGSNARYHHARFDAAGYWEQKGGLFGRSERDAGLFRFWRRKSRIAAEVNRLVPVRGQYEFTKAR